MKLTWHLQISENNPPGKGDSYWKPKQIPTNPSISFAKIGRSNWFFSNQVHPFTNSGQDDNISHFLRPSQHGGPTKSRFYDGVVSDGVIRNTCRVMVMATKIGVLFKPLSHWVLPLPWPMCWHKFRGNKKNTTPRLQLSYLDKNNSSVYVFFEVSLCCTHHLLLGEVVQGIKCVLMLIRLGENSRVVEME